MPPSIRRSSAFPRYGPTAEEAPTPNPNRFALARLGITEEMLVARIDAEVDEALRSGREERLARETPAEIPRPLSKEDCLAIFRQTGVPSPASGATWSIWRWAANLDEARFNFEDDGGDLSFLDDWIIPNRDVLAASASQPIVTARDFALARARANPPE